MTLVGIPLGLLGLLSLGMLYALGYLVAALTIGRMVVKEPRSVYLAFLAGLAIIRLVGVIPVLGGLAAFLASAVGLGAVAIAGWRAARRRPSSLAGESDRPVVPSPVGS
ncbi:MAG: hypothetical protein M3450_10815 [Actinomycetota bacterium]|nr:hypothetical protein [Actinomycetota bacterium]